MRIPVDAIQSFKGNRKQRLERLEVRMHHWPVLACALDALTKSLFLAIKSAVSCAISPCVTAERVLSPT